MWLERTVHVRWATIDDVDGGDDVLNAAPRVRERAVSPRERQRIVGVRRLLLGAVVEVMGADAARVALHQSCPRCGGQHGRPVVTVDGRRGPMVSMSHAGDLAMVAVADRPLGVDVEPDASARGWVRTEAVLKATGTGITVDPSLLRFGTRRGRPRLVGWDGPGRRPRIVVFDIDIGAAGVAALAVSSGRGMALDVRHVPLS